MDVESIQIGDSPGVHARLWTNAAGSGIGDSAGHVIVVHGLGDHGGRFLGLARRLVEQHFGVLAIDLPGHGRSPGRRGRAPSYCSLLQTIAEARRCLMERFGKTQQILVGHSMGGNLVMNYTLRHEEFDEPWMPKPDRLVLIAPMLMPPQVVDRPRLVAAWLTGHLFRWIHLSRDVRLDQLTSDSSAAATIRADSLQHNQVSLYLATQLLAQGRFVIDHAGEITTPTLVLVGDQDELIDRGACQNLAFRMPSIEISRWTNGRHDLLHDVVADRVLDRICDFVNDQQPNHFASKAA